MEIVDGKAYMSQVKALIIEYTDTLNRDLSFQNIDKELENPAEKYTAPNGEIIVAADNGNVLGMVAYHKLNDLRCEMKRLYVKPEARGLRLGDALVREIISRAVQAGFAEMVLDTIRPLKAAISLYNKYGFEECLPYYYNLMSDVIYMLKKL